MWHRISQREKYILIVTIAVLGILLADKIVFRRITGLWHNTDEKIFAKQNQLRRFQRTLDRFESTPESMHTLTVTLEQKGSNQEEMTEFLQQVEYAARQSRVNIVDIKPLPVEEEKIFRAYKTNLEVESPWPQLIKFMDTMRNAAEPMQVEHLTIRREKEQSSAVRGRFVIKKVLIVSDNNASETLIPGP